MIVDPQGKIIYNELIVVIPFLPLLISWRWNWWEAWENAIISILGFAIGQVLAARIIQTCLPSAPVSCNMRMPNPGKNYYRLIARQIMNLRPVHQQIIRLVGSQVQKFYLVET